MPGYIAEWLKAQGHQVKVLHLYQGEPLPSLDDFDWLVVMGGPMSVHDEDQYPWLREEKRLLHHAIQGGKTLLGVCLGAQLLAEVLGGRVQANPHREIGWYPTHLTPEARRASLLSDLPDTFTPLHWHGEAFTNPPGARRLAYSEACPNQAFQYGDRVLGLQFHLEVRREEVEAFVASSLDELAEEGPYIQRPEAILDRLHLAREANQLLARVLARMAGQATLK